ncbi:hypothetical protein JCM19237_1339 [Photobacterium aphoticum]|uniref:Uncharacterized protein n=1 Tax=Photobacterium aphoticum TaxID=754436 RepID=A0A090RAP9_9GAMM|nr:hypothetical protein JCM19237_1339 [Photobacterium aphoticum]
MDDHFDKPWIDVRRFEIFAAQGLEKQAIEMYQQVVACGEETYWLYATRLSGQKRARHLRYYRRCGRHWSRL